MLALPWTDRDGHVPAGGDPTVGEQGLELGMDSLRWSRGVLRDFGNMSSATLMFVLDRIIRGGETKLLTAHRNAVEWRNRTPHIVSKYLLGDLEQALKQIVDLSKKIKLLDSLLLK